MCGLELANGISGSPFEYRRIDGHFGVWIRLFDRTSQCPNMRARVLSFSYHQEKNYSFALTEQIFCIFAKKCENRLHSA